MKEKIYISGIYVREKTGDYGPFLSLSIDVETLTKAMQQHKKVKGSKETFSMIVSPRHFPSDTGVTHSVALDTWEPKQNAGSQTKTIFSAPKSYEKPPDRSYDSGELTPDDGDSIPF